MDAVIEKKTIKDAQRLLDEEKYPVAIKVLTEFLQDNPSSSEALKLRAEASILWGDAKKALNDILQAIQIEPENSTLYHTLGLIYLDNQEFSNAEIEFRRAIHLAPDVIEYKASLCEAKMFQGDISGALTELEEYHEASPTDEHICGNLAICYYEAAVEGWHRETTNEGEFLYATSYKQVKNAQRYYDKIKQLPQHIEKVKIQQEELQPLLKVSKKRQYNGGFFSWVLPIFVLFLGLGSGGFWGLFYAISALTFFYANWRPAYVTNHLIYTNKSDIPLSERMMSYIDGDWMVFSTSMTGAIFEQIKLRLIISAIRSFLVCLLMPISVFSSLRKNYNLKQASIFLAVALVIGIFPESYNSYTQSLEAKRYSKTVAAIQANDLTLVEELFTAHPHIAAGKRAQFIQLAIEVDSVEQFEYMLARYNITLNNKGRRYYQYAKQRNAERLMAFLAAYKPVERVPSNSVPSKVEDKSAPNPIEKTTSLENTTEKVGAVENSYSFEKANYWGHEITTHRNHTDMQKCAQLCFDLAECKVASFVGPNGPSGWQNSCTLRKAVGKRVTIQPDIHSWVKHK